MYLALAYDISDNRRRARVARVLTGYGRRVQYSVFEADLTQRQAEDMLARVEGLLERGDAFRIYHITGDADAHVIVWGGVLPVKTPRLIIA